MDQVDWKNETNHLMQKTDRQKQVTRDLLLALARARYIDQIKDFIAMQAEGIASRSLVNCHAEGLDSLLLDNTPGARVRIFVANRKHTLWLNNPYRAAFTFTTPRPFSIAIHSHHCDVRLVALTGRARNVIYSLDQERALTTPLTWPLVVWPSYRYRSAISTGKIGFEKQANQKLQMIDMRAFADVRMPASELHTVYVPRGECASWVVFEGAEDPDYNGLCYSNADLENFDGSELYKPMSVDYLKEMLDEWPTK